VTKAVSHATQKRVIAILDSFGQFGFDAGFQCQVLFLTVQRDKLKFFRTIAAEAGCFISFHPSLLTFYPFRINVGIFTSRPMTNIEHNA